MFQINKTNHFSKEFEKIIIDDYLKGFGCATLSKKHNLSSSSVYRILKRNNIKPRTHREAQLKYSFNENYFECINNDYLRKILINLSLGISWRR